MSDDARHLERLAERAVSRAVALGAEWADAAAAAGRSLSAEVESSSIAAAQAHRSTALNVRAFVRGAMGAAWAHAPAESQVDELAAQAVDMARCAEADPDFVALPPPEETAEVDGLFDPAVAGLPAGQVARWAAANIEAARAEAAEVILSGEVSAGWAEAAMASSTGILLARRSSSLHVGMMALLRDGSGVGSYYEYDLGRRLADVQPETVAVLATRQAAAYRRATPGPTGRMPVVLGPNAAYELICEVGDAAEADGIQRGRSVFAGRLGRRIGSPLLTLTDDGLIPAGVYSADRDGEGAPRRRVQICREGVLTGLLHSSYTAHKAGVPNTGHADRGGGISPTQLQLARGSRSAAQIIADVGRGLYVEHVDLDPDTASGQISATADYALRIENGRLTRPVRNTMLAGDLFEWLAALDAVSSDFRAEPGLAMPTVRLADVQVVGGRTS